MVVIGLHTHRTVKVATQRNRSFLSVSWTGYCRKALTERALCGSKKRGPSSVSIDIAKIRAVSDFWRSARLPWTSTSILRMLSFSNDCLTAALELAGRHHPPTSSVASYSAPQRRLNGGSGTPPRSTIAGCKAPALLAAIAPGRHQVDRASWIGLFKFAASQLDRRLRPKSRRRKIGDHWA
jgi:hypothetical protein